MFVFPADDPDRAVLSLQAMKRDCDAWLAKRGYPDVMVVKVQLGPVACGQVDPPGDERFDVYGLTVNHAVIMRGGVSRSGPASSICCEPNPGKALRCLMTMNSWQRTEY